jgi:hypothetical protein
VNAEVKENETTNEGNQPNQGESGWVLLFCFAWNMFVWGILAVM